MKKFLVAAAAMLAQVLSVAGSTGGTAPVSPSVMATDMCVVDAAGRGTLETTFGPLEYRKGDFLVIPKGIAHRFELGAGRHYYWMYESFAGDPEKADSPTTGRFITHSESDYRYPRSLDTRNEAGRFEIVSKVGAVYTRRVHPTHPFDVVGWRGDYLPYRFAVEDVRPLTADRSHVPPSGHTGPTCRETTNWFGRCRYVVIPRPCSSCSMAFE